MTVPKRHEQYYQHQQHQQLCHNHLIRLGSLKQNEDAAQKPRHPIYNKPRASMPRPPSRPVPPMIGMDWIPCLEATPPSLCLHGPNSDIPKAGTVPRFFTPSSPKFMSKRAAQYYLLSRAVAVADGLCWPLGLNSNLDCFRMKASISSPKRRTPGFPASMSHGRFF